MTTSEQINKELLSLLSKAERFERAENKKARHEYSGTDFRPISFGKRVQYTGMGILERTLMRKMTYHEARADIFKNLRADLDIKLGKLEQMVK